MPEQERTTRLVITRNWGEALLIGDAKVIFYGRKIVIEAPESVPIRRDELREPERKSA